MLMNILCVLAMAVWLPSLEGLANSNDNNAEMNVTETNRVLGGSVGAILDYSSRIGKEEKVAMEMAREDFYSRTNRSIILQLENSHGDPIQAALAATHLINTQNVEAILGPRTWEEASLVAEIGSISHVPILSFADSPPWATMKWPFLIQAYPSQHAQMRAVASIIQSWGWQRVVVIYEDNDSSTNGLIPYLHQSLLEVGAQISQFVAVPAFASSSLSQELDKLKSGQCRVFVVHTSLALAIQLFEKATKTGMMEQGYVWITTDAITNLVHVINSTGISSMQGVLGVRSYSSETRPSFHDFSTRFMRKFRTENPEENNYEPGIFALQAYDATMAVAMAMIEGKVKGQKLMDKILLSDFDGLSGKVSFSGRKLPPASSFQIINIFGKGYKEHGFWTDNGLGFSRTTDKGATYNNSMENLGHVYWPGEPSSTPKGWALPTNSSKLRIGVANGTMFNLFVTISYDPNTNNYTFSGFSVEVFRAAIENLPYDLPYDLIPFTRTFDDLVEQVHLKHFDAAVGSIAITARRYQKVDFSQPHTDAAMVMIVPIQSQTHDKAMLFLKSFTTTMWVLTVLVNLYNGFVVWIIERDHSTELRGTAVNQIGTLIWLAFATLFTLNGEKLHSNLSRVATMVWLFVALVVAQSYTANLTSMLTVRHMEPTVANIETLKYNHAMVGFARKSFVKNYLVDVLKFSPIRVRNYTTPEDIAQALRSKEIAAAFLEAPWAKLFLDRYCKSFMAAGPTYKVGGYAFAFPKGSPFLSDINAALTQVIDSGTLGELEDKSITSERCVDVDSDDEDVRLSRSSFWVLFVLTGGTSSVALVTYVIRRE
ncbi:glutamate receptor 2.8-like [Diospyros lotus]|uniref:glutamate receptor 2.8-like n=1 Tax=Diospyros lotus TaxID=55363 RepID=UPI0022510F66|nr:glutamate receptor 2.8-like [Diospyros lotus]